jgi:DNA polymerase III sliding clamp (beta) subunit (PCNA family)
MLYNQNNLNVARFAAKSGVRPELGSALFTKSKTVATDGIRLLEVSVPSGVEPSEWPKQDGLSAMRGCEPFLADAKMVAERVRLPRKPSLPIFECAAIAHLDDSKVEFITSDLDSVSRSVIKRIDGKFPDYEQLFPAGAPVAEVMLNGKALVELLKTMSELDEKVRIKFYGADKPVVLECEQVDRQRARGLMMPMMG